MLSAVSGDGVRRCGRFPRGGEINKRETLFLGDILGRYVEVGLLGSYFDETSHIYMLCGWSRIQPVLSGFLKPSSHLSLSILLGGDTLLPVGVLLGLVSLEVLTSDFSQKKNIRMQ